MEELREIVKAAGVPFIVKGIMTVKGALKAKEAGAAAIVVSNHGGRVLDQCPATAEVLEEIAKAVDGSMKIFVDGGIRSGTDVFKALALGADAVIIARPFVTAVYGGGREGVEAYIQKIGSELADTMVRIGELAKRETVAILTPMKEPLGRNVGNSLEVIEAIEALNGNMAEDVKNVVLLLGANMLKLAGKGGDLEENKKKMLENISNGKALAKLKELVESQGGDASYIDEPSKFKKAECILPVYAEGSGTINKLDAEEVGELSVFLGAGRMQKEDKIEPEAGISLEKKIGDRVEKGDTLAYIHANNKDKAEKAVGRLKSIYQIIA